MEQEQQMSEKIYIGNGKEKHFNDGGSVINLTIGLDGIAQYFKDYGFTTDQGKKKLKLVVQKRREIDQYGNSHYVCIDQFKPDSSKSNNSSHNTNDDENIPF